MAHATEHGEHLGDLNATYGDKLKLSILSPERRLVESIAVENVTLTGSEGQIQILPGHSAAIGILDTGAFSYQRPDLTFVSGVISNGFFQVRANEVFVMAENFELKDEIDIDRAKKAQQLAENNLQQANLDAAQFKKYQLKLQRSLIRQEIALEPLAKIIVEE